MVEEKGKDDWSQATSMVEDSSFTWILTVVLCLSCLFRKGLGKGTGTDRTYFPTRMISLSVADRPYSHCISSTQIIDEKLFPRLSRCTDRIWHLQVGNQKNDRHIIRLSLSFANLNALVETLSQEYDLGWRMYDSLRTQKWSWYLWGTKQTRQRRNVKYHI